MKDLKIYAKTIEDKAKEQIDLLLSQDAFKDAKVRIMPDVHAGAGCVIGFTGDLGDKVIPNVVGVDLGCLDKDTEILTPNGWVKINEYRYGEQILVYDKFKDNAFFDTPYAYIKKPCKEFYHFEGKGLDQMLSEEHKMLIWRGYKGKGYTQTIEIAKDVFEHHNKHTKSNKAIKTTFELAPFMQTRLDEFWIRCIVMVSADGHIHHLKNGNSYIELHFKKERKIKRAKQILNEMNINFKEKIWEDKSTNIGFTLPGFIEKDLLNMLGWVGKEKAKIIIDEIYNWDGTIDKKRQSHKFFSTTIKRNADYIQTLLASIGIRAGISKTTYPNPNWKPTYNVYQTLNEYVGLPDRQMSVVPSIDGFKYCFTTSTGFFIIRRNGCISITGNCGIMCVYLANLDIDLEELDKVINEEVPSGFNVHDKAYYQFPLEDLYCYEHLKDTDRLLRSIGTLGGGNHFIEVDIDENGDKYLVIHTGSRNLGKQVADYYQNLANDVLNYGKDEYLKEKQEIIENYKENGENDKIQAKLDELSKKYRQNKHKIPKELAYLEGKNRENYLHDMAICQEYARLNRLMIANIILDKIDKSGVLARAYFESVHNYISFEDNIVRKGAIQAKKGQKVIIPMNMRDGSIIGVGLGNEDWNMSAPHGAGRLMSRMKARDTLSNDEFKETMEGIYSTSVCKETLDEAPMCYKPMEEILECVRDTIEIEKIIKPIYNFKAKGEY